MNKKGRGRGPATRKAPKGAPAKERTTELLDPIIAMSAEQGAVAIEGEVRTLEGRLLRNGILPVGLESLTDVGVAPAPY